MGSVGPAVPFMSVPVRPAAEPVPPNAEFKVDVPHQAEDDPYAGDFRTNTLSSRGMIISFEDLTYTVVNSQNKKEKINLLKGISGYFLPGQMSALMGPSGSGKTTLLDLLAGRKTVGETQGKILFAGVPPTSMFLRRYTGYVEQFDTLLDILTVREMLMYTAELKRPEKENFASKKAAVEKLISDLGLEPCQNVRIGNPLRRGISGGQAKRVNIGIALVTNPRVLFLDEPTSGLDSYTSNEVMTVVKSLVKEGITICATIHSPTPYCFRLFDRLFMLLRGGVVYFGPRGPEAVEFFMANSPNTAKLAEGENEAEWIVDLTTAGDRQKRAGDFQDAYAQSELYTTNARELAGHMQQTSTLRASTMEELKIKRATVTSFGFALKTLIKYRTVRNYQSAEFLGPRIGDKLIFSLLILTLFWKVGARFNTGEVANMAGVLFMWTTLPAFGASSYVPSIVLERGLFMRERNDGLYRVITYMVAKMLDELMLAFVASLLFSCIVWFGVKLSGDWVLFWLVYFCTLSIGIALAYLISALSPNMEVANAALPTYVVIQLFFAGFLLRYSSIPNYYKWYSYLDFMRWGWGAQMVNQFSHHRDLMFDGQPVLDYYSLGGASKWAYLGYEFIFFCVFFTAAWAALQFVNHSRR